MDIINDSPATNSPSIVSSTESSAAPSGTYTTFAPTAASHSTNTPIVVVTASQYVGCYVDDGERDMGPIWTSVSTVEECQAHCDKKYFALQAAFACFCSDVYNTKPAYAKVDDSECGGVVGTSMGTAWRNAVYINNNHGHASSIAITESPAAPSGTYITFAPTVASPAIANTESSAAPSGTYTTFAPTAASHSTNNPIVVFIPVATAATVASTNLDITPDVAHTPTSSVSLETDSLFTRRLNELDLEIINLGASNPSKLTLLLIEHVEIEILLLDWKLRNIQLSYIEISALRKEKSGAERRLFVLNEQSIANKYRRLSKRNRTRIMKNDH